MCVQVSRLKVKKQNLTVNADDEDDGKLEKRVQGTALSPWKTDSSGEREETTSADV